MRTWGYIKEVILAKLDLTEKEAEVQNLINRFQYYANEAITQICSAVKPKHTFAEFNVFVKIEDVPSDITDYVLVGNKVRMPDDFVSFDDDINRLTYTDQYDTLIVREAHDDDFDYVGNNEVLFKVPGKFLISYNAAWFDFYDVDNNVVVDVPNDILDCIPSYVASQCMKIDDEYKASVYRNEYEMFLARIDDTHYKSNKTFRIEGDW
jgi:hypothetical protein